MKKNKVYLIRLDDCHSRMNVQKWDQILDILKRQGIRPLVGVIPDNKDPKLEYNKTSIDIYSWITSYSNEITPAIHGENHNLTKSPTSLYKGMQVSEFCGLSYDDQVDKLKSAKSWFLKRGINVKWFIAPKHSFNKDTIRACGVLDLNISDGIEFFPYKFKENNVVLVPQIFNIAREVLLPGVYTFCYHPDTMTTEEFIKLEEFLKKNRKYFIQWDDSLNHVKGSFTVSLILNYLYTYVRNIVYK